VEDINVTTKRKNDKDDEVLRLSKWIKRQLETFISHWNISQSHFISSFLFSTCVVSLLFFEHFSEIDCDRFWFLYFFPFFKLYSQIKYKGACWLLSIGQQLKFKKLAEAMTTFWVLSLYIIYLYYCLVITQSIFFCFASDYKFQRTVYLV
jgi:hypothetical protein